MPPCVAEYGRKGKGDVSTWSAAAANDAAQTRCAGFMEHTHYRTAASCLVVLAVQCAPGGHGMNQTSMPSRLTRRTILYRHPSWLPTIPPLLRQMGCAAHSSSEPRGAWARLGFMLTLAWVVGLAARACVRMEHMDAKCLRIAHTD